MRELQPWEKFEDRQSFIPIPTLLLRRKEDILREMLAPCGRFNSVATWEERITTRISSTVSKLDSFGSDTFMFARGVALNWQLLLDYLYANGLTASQNFMHRYIPTDLPRRVSIDLAGADISLKTDGRPVNPYGFGRSPTLEESMSKAVGELLERYFLAVYRTQDFLTMSYQDVVRSGKRALDIRHLNDFLPWQKEKFPRFKRDETKPIHWVKGFEMISGKKTPLPAQLVFWSYRFNRASPEPMLMESNTNGGAGHFSREEAILAALLEVIQRDGFMIYWLNRISPNVLDISTVTDNESIELLREMRRYQIDFFFLNTTTDLGVPSCVCVVIDRSGAEPVLALGGGSGFSERELIFQSASEALTVLTKAKSEQFDIADSYVPFTDSRISRDQRLGAWHGREMLERFNFFISGKSQTVESFLGEAFNLRSVSARLEYVLDRLKAQGEGYECYCYEVGHPVLTKLNYHVVRAIVPKLMHLYLIESNATLGADRLRQTPAKLGHKPAEHLNPWPHPFP